MKKYICLLAIVFLCGASFSQDSVVVQINVVDDQFSESIQNVTITAIYNDENLFASTDRRGIAYFLLPTNGNVLFKLSHEKYFITSNPYKKISSRNSADTLVYTFDMKFEGLRTQDLQEMVIGAPGVPVPVFASKRLHVEDFEVMSDGNLLLLTYSKRLKKGSELVVFDGFKTKQTFQVSGIAEELVRDYRGNPHVICRENVFGIHLNGDVVGVSRLEKAYYMKYLAPVVDTNTTKMYFSTFNPDYPTFEYFSYDQLDSTYKRISGVTDELMMELYRSEYKWMDVRTKLWAKNLELQTGVDAEIYVGASYFTQSVYYKELYAPMFHRNDTLFLFDYYKDRLFSYDREGEPLDSVGIYHHYQPKRTGWEKQLIQDRATGQIYALFERSGYSYLGWVDTKTGEITQQVKLEYRYVNKVSVYNNFIYYTYRPFESPQKKYLYKERLPYDFGHAFVPDGDDGKEVGGKE